jgi:V8-like Glu-specific endopeptidase
MKRISSLALAAVLVFSINTQANEAQPYRTHGKSICGSTDDRDFSSEPRVARVRQESAPAGCTITMIGRTCAVSAGHCSSTFGIAEFNTQPSVDGRITPSLPEDTYKVDAESAVYLDRGQGRDWAVVRILANEITGALPGDAQGNYTVSYEMPNVGDVIRITGYGTARGSDRNFAQQTHTGEIASMVRGGSIRHVADTTGGNSGSSIILEASQEIIGIHTHGGCFARGGSNSGTMIAGNDDFQNAINSCLQWEDENL